MRTFDDPEQRIPTIRGFLNDPMSPNEIEQKSFEAIDAEAPSHGFSGSEWSVVRRMIHASADFELIREVGFSTDGVSRAVRALCAGAPIYVDANMARAGLSMARLRRVNLDYSPSHIHCHIADADVAEAAKQEGLPRSIFALRKAKPMLEGAIAAFGNAPLALMELSRMIVEEDVRPAFVVAMPVGFVHVVESKEELVALGAPHVTIRGRRGGSALAVSAIHALCSIAENKEEK